MDSARNVAYCEYNELHNAMIKIRSLEESIRTHSKIYSESILQQQQQHITEKYKMKKKNVEANKVLTM